MARVARLVKCPERHPGGVFRLMLSVIYGEDRVAAEGAVKRLLGTNYEVFEGEDLAVADLPSIFQGTSLFGVEKRQILLKNLTENKAVWEKIGGYTGTEHEIVIWEPKLDKRSATYKALKAAKVRMQEFIPRKPVDAGAVFQVFDMALRDGRGAVRMLEKFETQQEPYMFFGLLVSQGLKKYGQRSGEREKAILKLLAETDMQLKTTSLEPWLIVKSFLLRVGEL